MAGRNSRFAEQSKADVVSFISDCGLLVGQARIIGGNELDDFKYPWFAQLLLGGKSDQAICAGSLISPRHILTAAHCFDM